MKSKLLIGSIILVIGVAIVGLRDYTGEAKASGDEIKSIKVDKVSKESNEPVAIVYDKEIGVWLSEMNAMLSAPLDDPRLKEANNDEGFEYYLKAQKVMDSYPNQTPTFLGDAKLEIEFSNLNMLEGRISLLQFSRTSHLDSYGLAKEDTSLYDQWKPSDDDMRQAFEYFSQLVNDLDVAFNHGGEGETFGVTHLLNGAKVSEIEPFLNNLE
ncbi:MULTISPECIES: hypothetical protein [unclassified Sporosarcina]|uniref:hypothetical protein n=1 Tax=unclassified Sporosarcina TaxID=2647733 RepID=UPI001A912810|nr:MULTISPECIES: hypothetical protein [unclassified Sporosarcina]MBO0587615.1 hypothetical protein [Sporosarcina sp. E16_8]MBO0602395.1 hypothetical protein [Sporosarcina sp. E16_3]